MNIEIVIPFGVDCKLGESMNHTMERLDDGDWCIFIDSDVLMMTEHFLWYDACLNLIHKEGYKIGFTSCVTNRIGCEWQKPSIPVDSEDDNIKAHFSFAHKLWNKHGMEYTIPSHGQKLSGMFIMTHKRAWKESGGFNQGWKVDNWYDEAIIKAGYLRAIMQGVYCYHIYKKKKEWTDEWEKKLK